MLWSYTEKPLKVVLHCGQEAALLLSAMENTVPSLPDLIQFNWVGEISRAKSREFQHR